MSQFLSNPVWFARATITLAASGALTLVLLLGERVLAAEGEVFAVGLKTFLFWLASGVVVTICGIQGGRELLRTRDSRGDARLVIYAMAACLEYGSRSQILRYTYGLTLDLGIALDDVFVGVNPLGLMLFAWLLYLRGQEMAAGESGLVEGGGAPRPRGPTSVGQVHGHTTEASGGHDADAPT